MGRLLREKLSESVFSVLPIIVLVLFFNFTIAPIPFWNLMLFLFSTLVMILGITLFNLGVDTSLIPIGEKIGTALVKSKNLYLIIFITFLTGILISIAEPDLLVLAGQVSGVDDSAIIAAVSLGVGLAVVGAFLRVLFQIPYSWLISACYLLAFALSNFTGRDFVSIAWESGAVTTGPIVVPFIMALGIGVASVRGDKTTEEDSFGLVSFCLMGPIIATLILGIFFSPSGESALIVPQKESFGDILAVYLRNLPTYLGQVAAALFPMLVLFGVFQAARLRLKKKEILKICVGTVYTYAGLVLFLLSANVGFMRVGYQLGTVLSQNANTPLLILSSAAVGFFVVAAEPAVFVLKRQVEEITAGAISGRMIGIGLSIGVAVSAGLSMLRVATGMPLLYIILPGYLIALILAFIVPHIFTSIAFDSGAVASGPLAATFMLPFAIGACEARGGNIFADAFGIVALISMTPVIVLQLYGLAFLVKTKISEREALVPISDDTIIELDYDPDSDNDSDEPANEDKSGDVNNGGGASEIAEEPTI